MRADREISAGSVERAASQFHYNQLYMKAFAVAVRVVLGVAALAIGVYRVRYIHMDPRYGQMGFVFFAVAAYFFWRAWQSYTTQR